MHVRFVRTRALHGSRTISEKKLAPMVHVCACDMSIPSKQGDEQGWF